MRVQLFAPLLLGLLGCGDFFGDHDAHAPGTPLGRFQVNAELGANGCGAGALGAPASWEFDVSLARESEQLFWDSGGQTLTGTLTSAGAFAFDAVVRIDMRDGGKGPACVVYRGDTASGQLAGEPVEGFSGTLGYAYAAEGVCEDLVYGPQPMFAQLPCSMSYAMSAILVEPPAAE
jgi:hypothetical protein